jgi:membrane protease YdiL (CAAX protease family)
VELALPWLFVRVADGKWPSWFRPRTAGLGWGLAFGLFVAGGILGLYFTVLREWAPLRAVPGPLVQKYREMGIDHPATFFTFAAFIALIHSGLEEYYWRWFIFGRLRRLTNFPTAAALACLSFMAHHVLLLHLMMPGYFWVAVLPLSLAVAVGGLVWVGMYERWRSLTAAWLSHLLIDAAIMILAWDLVWRGAG